MSRILLGSLFLFCWISQNYALRCYQCQNCENVMRVNEQTCLTSDLVCGKIEVEINMENVHQIQTTKGCLPPIKTDCKSYMTDIMKTSGLFQKDAVDTIDRVFHMPGVEMKCASCTTDFCNSSTTVFPSVFTFALLLLLIKLY